MRRLTHLMVVWLFFVAFAGAAQQQTPEENARRYADAFISGDMQPLLEHASPELKALMKDKSTLNMMRAGTIGDKAVPADEQITVVYSRIVKAASGQSWSIMATVDPGGQLSGFLIRPASEAASKFLDYKTKADLRLPFDGPWTVFWGGRSINENYHAAYPDQRFAYDILIMREGVSHGGAGAANEDYFSYGQPIVAPGAGKVVLAVDGIADNTPGKMNPKQATGNHVVLDLGNDEYLFIAHLKNGSVKVKTGDKVAQGDPLGSCGNSGNTSEPHLHIHLQTTPNFGAGQGLPLQFQHYQADGKAVARGEPTKGQAIHDDQKAAAPVNAADGKSKEEKP